MASCGRKAANAGASTMPLPGSFSTRTLPVRMASIRPGDADAAVHFQLQRIDQAAIDAAHQHINGLQAAQGFEIERAVAHGEVAAFDQHAGQLAR